MATINRELSPEEKKLLERQGMDFSKSPLRFSPASRPAPDGYKRLSCGKLMPWTPADKIGW